MGTSTGVAKRQDRCERCGCWHPRTRPCPPPYERTKKTDEEKRATALAYLNRWRAENPDAWKALGKRYRDNLRLKVLRHYSGSDDPFCACCGIRGRVFLTLDHIDGNGAAERRTGRHRGGTAQYAQLKRDGFPPGYQVLCWNCNSAKHLLTACPCQLPLEGQLPLEAVDLL